MSSTARIGQIEHSHSGEGAEGGIEPLARAVVDVSPVPMLVVDDDANLLAANRPWHALSGRDEAASAGVGWMQVLGDWPRRRLAEHLVHARATARAASVDLEVALPGGSRWTRWWVQRKSIGGRPLLSVVVVDVHDDVAQRADLHALAISDHLTGLANRRYFMETVEQALRRADRFPEPACVLYVDLDGFKRVNDEGGHAIGDRVLAAVASRLRLAVRGADVVGRIGGDEFAVLIERVSSPEQIDPVTRRVEAALNGPVEVAGRSWPVAASVGVATSRPGDDADALLGRADDAMYRAKRARGNRPAEPPVLDIRALQEGVDTIRRSLEAILHDLGADR